MEREFCVIGDVLVEVDGLLVGVIERFIGSGRERFMVLEGLLVY